MVTTPQICRIEKAPKWMVDNRFLLGGYRVGFSSFKSTLKSLFELHNELMNVWTHLVGAIIFLAILVLVTGRSLPESDHSPELNYAMRTYLFHSNHWTTVYKDQVEPHLRQLETDPLRLTLTANNVGFLEHQRANIAGLFQKGLVKLDTELRQHVTADEEAQIDQLTTTFAQTDSFAQKFFKFLSNNVDAVRQADPHKPLTHLESYVAEAARNLRDKFENLRTQEKDTRHMFRAHAYQLETYPIAVFLTTVVFCLLSSTIFHLFNPISKCVYTVLHKTDLAGISILIFGSAFAMFHYYFYCQPIVLIVYGACIFVFCFGAFFVSLGDAIHLERNVKWKSLMYAVLGLINVVPMVHMMLLSLRAGPDNDYLPPNKCFLLMLLMAVLYLGGLAIYTFRFPERFYPHTFDIWLNSHTIWHLFVFAAALTHFVNLLYLYETRHALPCL